METKSNSIKNNHFIQWERSVLKVAEKIFFWVVISMFSIIGLMAFSLCVKSWINLMFN